MFGAGREFLQTQLGNGNPYKPDSTVTWLDWDRVKQHPDIFLFFQAMLAFRKEHPSVGRSLFWRDDVAWYGAEGGVDWSYDSHSLAYCLHGASQNDDDLYVMINSYWRPVAFFIQEGQLGEWRWAIDTYLESPDDISEGAVTSESARPSYTVQPRSVVVLAKTADAATPAGNSLPPQPRCNER